MLRGGSKVGEIDDPVWSEPLPAVIPRRAKNHCKRLVETMRHRRGWVGAIIGAVLLLVAGFLVLELRPPWGGDPGDQVFKVLREQLIAAVPPGASTVHISATPVEWLQGCPGLPVRTQPGWGQAHISVGFTDLGNPITITTQIASALKRLGWQRHDTVPTPGQGKVAHWVRDMHKGKLASAFAYPVPAGSSSWGLNVTWQPPGPVGYGCP